MKCKSEFCCALMTPYIFPSLTNKASVQLTLHIFCFEYTSYLVPLPRFTFIPVLLHKLLIMANNTPNQTSLLLLILMLPYLLSIHMIRNACLIVKTTEYQQHHLLDRTNFPLVRLDYIHITKSPKLYVSDSLTYNRIYHYVWTDFVVGRLRQLPTMFCFLCGRFLCFAFRVASF